LLPRPDKLEQVNPIPGQPRGIGFSCKTVGFTPPHYSITLRFATNTAAPDDNHQDAYHCFQTIRSLVSDVNMWRVDFDDSLAVPENRNNVVIENVSGHHPTDCGAMVLVVRDAK
jgi:hypothetical protein